MGDKFVERMEKWQIKARNRDKKGRKKNELDMVKSNTTIISVLMEVIKKKGKQ
jgi:hypothetical protein